MTWRPISEAPKDGTDVLVWDGRYVRIGYGMDGDDPVWQADGFFFRPKVWMPLPDPPKEDE